MAFTEAIGSAFKDFTQDTFMKLFLTQLKHQDPMEPMDNYEFTSQLAQMGQLEQLSNMTSQFEQVMRYQEFGYASQLIGKEVAYVLPGAEGPRTGVVSGVRLQDGEVQLVVEDSTVPLSSVTDIREAEQPQA
ncbi:MAG: flagellar hook capping FlgD N-terminal domain-containing protein [Candidatus Brocadiia bacterium]